MPTQKSTAKKIAKDDWVQELGEAESAAKRSRSAGAQLRLAIAAYKLREFKKLKIAANLGRAGARSKRRRGGTAQRIDSEDTQFTNLNDPIIPQGTTSEEYRTTQTDLIRSWGLTFLDDFNGRRCGVKDWDPMLYAGVVDCIDTDKYFMWNDLHWRLTKVELSQRTKEWNDALEKYCDGVGLTGAEREAVVLKHTANPCAPCPNPSCNNWETEPKEFKSCSRCKSVAYCSRDCQKKDWKAQHKSTWCVAT